MPDDTKELLEKLMETIEKAYQDSEPIELEQDDQAILYVINRFAYMDDVFIQYLRWATLFYFICKKSKDAESLITIIDAIQTYIGITVSGQGKTCTICSLEDLVKKKGG